MRKQWQKLAEALTGTDQLSILLHDDPDPDAIASAMALQYLLAEELEIESKLFYRGTVGRAENKELLAYLDVTLNKIEGGPFDAGHPFSTNWAKEGSGTAVVDTQPGAGNSPLSLDYPATLVIDHHGVVEDSGGHFRDVRPWIGATATILTQYLQGAGLRPPRRLATALFYGIKTDTRALSRDTSAADVAAYFHLLSYIDVDAVVRIENAQVPAAYFQNLARAIEAAQVYDQLVFVYLGNSEYPDLAAEIADMFLRLEGIRWVVCLGAYGDALHLSLRARDEDEDAQEMARALVGSDGNAGGRNTLAGGHIALDEVSADELVETVRERALAYLEIDADKEGRSLT